MSKNNKLRRRNIAVSIRMTEAEKATFDKKVRASGMTQAEYFIRSALNRPIIVYGDSGEMEKLVYETNKIGVNLNQIAKRLNENEYVSGRIEYADMAEAFCKLTDAVLLLVEQRNGS